MPADPTVRHGRRLGELLRLALETPRDARREILERVEPDPELVRETLALLGSEDEGLLAEPALDRLTRDGPVDGRDSGTGRGREWRDRLSALGSREAGTPAVPPVVTQVSTGRDRVVVPRSQRREPDAERLSNLGLRFLIPSEIDQGIAQVRARRSR